MPCKVIDLRPNKDLLDTDFAGYKLSLDPIPIVQKALEKPVLRVLPSANNFSLLHSQLLTLYNHLIGETINGTDYTYFVDNAWQLNKVSLNPYSNTYNISAVFSIPEVEDKEQVGFNPSLQLVSNELAVLSNGLGMFYVLNTEGRNEDHPWTVLYSDKLEEVGDSFVIKDAKCTTVTRRKLDCIFLSIRSVDEVNKTFLHWLTFEESEAKVWEQTTFKEMSIKGPVYYCYLERNDNGFYIAGDHALQFTLDSENPVKSEEKITEKSFQWSQSENMITIKIPCISEKSGVVVNFTEDSLNVKISHKEFLEGQLYKSTKSSDNKWTLEDNILEITLFKVEEGVMWPELIPGDNTGEFVADPEDVKLIHERLAHLCSDSPQVPESGTLYNSEPIEECDFEDDKLCIFDRIDTISHTSSNRVYLNSHKILLTANISSDLTPAIALRHDVDGCLWQPTGSADNWSMKHDATLHAFGYVQASKQQRKFSVCPSDLSYVAICEASRHIFIYRQDKKVTSGELRNRSSGQLVKAVAQQQVVSIGSEEILGVYAANEVLYLITIKDMYALKL